MQGKKKSRLQKARAAPVLDQRPAPGAGNEEKDEVPEEDEGRAGQKKARKEAMKQYRADQKEAADERLEKKATKDLVRSEARRAKEEARVAAEREAKEADDKARAAKEEAEQAEFDDWKSMFETAEDGTGEAEALEESQGLLGEFISYIKKRKVVVVEDIAREFNLRSTVRVAPVNP